MKILIQKGRVLNPVLGQDCVMDILVEGEHIVQMAPSLEGSVSPEAMDRVITLSEQYWVAPGLVDVHVHFRDPGNPEKETTATGAEAAIAGGFTTVCVMPNTQPVIDSVKWVEYLVSAAKQTGINIHPIAAVSKGLEGKSMTEFGLLKAAGAVAFSDDGHPVANANLMRRALEYANMLAMPIVCHAEDCHLFAKGVMHEGYYSTKLGLPGIPSIAESVLVARDIEILRYTGGHVHFAHLSSKESVALVRQAKQEGLSVSAETTPHYLALTDAACQHFDANTRMNGPIRDREAQHALWEAVQDGTIDSIATDHAPHTPGQKALPFDCSLNGVIGLETSLGVMLTDGYHTGRLSPLTLIQRMSSQPARLFHLPHAGQLAVGGKANLCIIDPDLPWVVTPDAFKSRSRNSPFSGKQLTGKAVLTMANGICLHDKLHPAS